MAYQFTGRAGEAEELTQDIFLHLLGALPSFDRSGSLPAWIGRVSRNYAIDHYRKRRRERSLVSDGEGADERIRSAPDTSGGGDPHRALETRDLGLWLRGAIDRLPEELAQAVVMRDLQEMSYDEMARMLDVPLGTVKSRIHRGRIELARRLERRRADWGYEADGSPAPPARRGPRDRGGSS